MVASTRAGSRAAIGIIVLGALLFGVAASWAQGDNGGYPADVPTNRCDKCGTRYPTKQSDADLYGTVTIFVHSETCGQDPATDPPPADPVAGGEAPVTCGQVSCALDQASPKPSATSLAPAGAGTVAPGQSLLGSVLRQRILKLRAEEPAQLLPFAGWMPAGSNDSPLALDVPPGSPSDFWKQAAE